MALIGVGAAGIVYSGAGLLANFVITENPIFEKSVAPKGVDIGYLSIYIDSGYSISQPSTFVWSEGTNNCGLDVAKWKNDLIFDVAWTNNRFWNNSLIAWGTAREILFQTDSTFTKFEASNYQTTPTEDAISWRQAAIFDLNASLNNVGIIDCDIGLISHQVGSQTSFLSIVGSAPLLSREVGSGHACEQSSNKEPKHWIAPMFFTFGAILIIAGMSLGYEANGRRCWIGVIICATGWFGVVFQDTILSFSENASAFLGYGASATCYRGAENIRVVPVVVSPSEFSDVQRSEGQRQLCRRAATLSIMAESMECDAVGNNPFDVDLYGQLTDRLGRCLQRIGLERKARPVNDGSNVLSDYFSRPPPKEGDAP